MKASLTKLIAAIIISNYCYSSSEPINDPEYCPPLQIIEYRDPELFCYGCKPGFLRYKPETCILGNPDLPADCQYGLLATSYQVVGVTTPKDPFPFMEIVALRMLCGVVDNSQELCTVTFGPIPAFIPLCLLIPVPNTNDACDCFEYAMIFSCVPEFDIPLDYEYSCYPENSL